MNQAAKRSPRRGTWRWRWKNWIAATPSKPGVWRLRAGGYLVRARAKDPTTGKLTEVRRVLRGLDAAAAYARLQEERRRIRTGTPASAPCSPRFCDYAVSLLEQKLRTGEIKSAASRRQWANDLRVHLLPAFGLLYMDRIRRADVQAWRSAVAGLIASGRYSPATVNSWLDKLRVICNSAYHELELVRNPVAGVLPFDTRTQPTYTEEQPNSLSAPELQEFLRAVRQHYPQHFAMICLGFATGLRPSSLRALRRAGAECDVLWEEGALLVRRSHTVQQEVMNTTKTGRRQKLALPADLMEILRWHIEQLPAGPMRQSELLFPGQHGGFAGASTLACVYRRLSRKLGMRKRVTPRAMRRTFQDLARAAEVRDVVTRTISGHASAGMQHHYSTVSAEEMRHNLAKVVSLAGLRAALFRSGATGGATAAAQAPDARPQPAPPSSKKRSQSGPS